MQQSKSFPVYKIVYSICEHPYLGYLIEPHMVKLNPNGTYSLRYQRIFSNTVDAYAAELDEVDYKLIRLLDDIEQTNLIKKYYKKAIRPVDFFSKVFDKKLYDLLRPKIDEKMIQFFESIGDKPLFMMSKDGYPADQEIKRATSAASILFHFRRTEEETRYFPTIKYENQRLEFMFKNAIVLTNAQAWLILNNTLYYFDQALEGKKLSPFLNKRYISVGRSTEKKIF